MGAPAVFQPVNNTTITRPLVGAYWSGTNAPQNISQHNTNVTLINSANNYGRYGRQYTSAMCLFCDFDEQVRPHQSFTDNNRKYVFAIADILVVTRSTSTNPPTYTTSVFKDRWVRIQPTTRDSSSTSSIMGVIRIPDVVDMDIADTFQTRTFRGFNNINAGTGVVSLRVTGYDAFRQGGITLNLNTTTDSSDYRDSPEHHGYWSKLRDRSDLYFSMVPVATQGEQPVKYDGITLYEPIFTKRVDYAEDESFALRRGLRERDALTIPPMYLSYGLTNSENYVSRYRSAKLCQSSAPYIAIPMSVKANIPTTSGTMGTPSVEDIVGVGYIYPTPNLTLDSDKRHFLDQGVYDDIMDIYNGSPEADTAHFPITGLDYEGNLRRIPSSVFSNRIYPAWKVCNTDDGASAWYGIDVNYVTPFYSDMNVSTKPTTLSRDTIRTSTVMNNGRLFVRGDDTNRTGMLIIPLDRAGAYNKRFFGKTYRFTGVSSVVSRILPNPVGNSRISNPGFDPAKEYYCCYAFTRNGINWYWTIRSKYLDMSCFTVTPKPTAPTMIWFSSNDNPSMTITEAAV